MAWYPLSASSPLPKSTTRISPSALMGRAETSTTTSRGSTAESQRGLFLVPGERSSPFTTRGSPPSAR
jgi:hypothetical protein